MSEKKKLLWVSQFAPYDKVDHAGGKTHNYQIKYFNTTGKYDIHLITLASHMDAIKIDLDKYHIDYDCVEYDGNCFKNTIRIITNMWSVMNPWHKLGHTILTYYYLSLKNRLFQYSKTNVPEIVILQWTGAAMLIDYVKKVFPKSKIVVIEEDVSYLGMQRKIKGWYTNAIYKTLKKKELDVLNKADLIVVTNGKDKKLIVDDGIDSNNVYVVVPYYDDYSDVIRHNESNNILFFGNMGRSENHQAAMWFIDNVLPDLDTKYVFEIIGGRPREELLAKQSSRIQVRGFVEDIRDSLSECLCMVVPLQYGAGIKVKVLEAMSAGVPVMTGNIGIEGIGAQRDKDYIHAENKEEYLKYINNLGSNADYASKIGINSKEYIYKSYNIDNSLETLCSMISSM